MGRSLKEHFTAWAHITRIFKVAGKYRMLLGARALGHFFTAWREQAKRDHVTRLRDLRVAYKGNLLQQFYEPQGEPLNLEPSLLPYI